MNSLQQIIDSKIKIKVEFLDEVHEELLCNINKYPSDVVERMKKLVSDGLIVDGYDFLEYYLFHNKRYGIKKENFIEMIPCQSNMLRMHFDIKDNQLFKLRNIALDKGITEHIGESVGMLTISHCFDIISADWNFIPESNKQKTLDCSLAIANSGLIELEAKGTSAINISFSQPKKSILNKKKNKKPVKGKYYYGSITTIDTSNLTCYLLDPPGNDGKLDLKRLRVVNRLSYYYEILRIIAPKSELINILMERIESIRDYGSDIESLPELKPKNRSHFNYQSNNEPTFFFQSYYHDKENIKFGGRFFYLQRGVALFIGVENGLLNKIVNQNPDDLLTVVDELSSIEINELVNRSAIQTTTRDGQLFNVKINGKDKKIFGGKFFSDSSTLQMNGRVYIKNGLALGIISND